MSLALRIAIYISSVFIIFVSVTAYVGHMHFNAKIDEIERDKVNEISSRLVSLITQQQSLLLIKLSDWALWDDLHNYAIDRNKRFHDSNFTIDSMRTLHIHYLSVYDLQGRDIYAAALAPEAREKTSIPKSLREFVVNQSKTLSREGSAWITNVDDRLVVIAARPIQNNDGSGPIHGMLMMGYQVTPEIESAWSEILGVDFKTRHFEGKPEAQQVTHVTKDYLDIQDLLFDHEMKPVISFQYKIPRKIHKIANDFEWLQLFSLIIFVPIGIAGMVLILQTTLIRRFKHLEMEMKEAFRSDDKFVTINKKRGLDELDRLALTFNELLSRDRASQIQKQNQELRLVEASKLTSLGEMAGGIAHEINNPLAIIMARAGILKKKVSEKRDESEIQKDLQTIENTTERISKIVSGLRAFARDSTNEAPKMHLVSQIIGDAIALCSEKLRNNGVEIQIRIAHDDPIEVRAVQISQVLLNLIGNAYDATEGLASRWVRIEGQRINDRYVIRVIDSGNGISEAVASKIMNPFFTTKDVGKGTGLGLSISQSIVKDHQGALTLDRRALNTTFEINLPLKQSLSAPASTTVSRKVS